MNRIIIILVCTVFFSCNSRNQTAKTKVKKSAKNVLFIVVDDLTKSLNTYGNGKVISPNIDALAFDGIQFNNAYCNYSVCNPSRSSFLTGLKPETLGILDNVKPLQSVLGERVTLPALFHKNGYETVSFGKIFHKPDAAHNDLESWDIIKEYQTTALGEKGLSRNMTNGLLQWCSWLEAEGTDEDQEDGMIARDAVAYLASEKKKPFFLAVGLKKPHDPFNAPKKYFDMYPIEIVKVAEIPNNWFPAYKYTLPDETNIFNAFSEKDKKEFLRAYYACTSFMDVQVGKIIKALKASGEYNNTLIVFLGDHGYHLGEHNWWNKVTLFERGTSTPFIVSGNLVQHKNTESNAMFEFIDIYPMLADFCDLRNIPKYLEGESFVKVLENPGLSFKSEVHAVIQRGDILGKSVKNSEWRYVEWDNGRKGSELYNQHKDPMEYNNVSKDIANTVVIAKMKKLLYK